EKPCEAVEGLHDVMQVVKSIVSFEHGDVKGIGFGSVIFAVKPGDGSAREQAASCQKVLGGWANIANEYATKRYRSNLINWGMLPFIIEKGDLPFSNLDYILFPGIRTAVETKADTIKAIAIKGNETKEFTLTLGDLTDRERQIILDGCLINFNRQK
ncbi:MAG: hydratase, partial [Clostridiales bacterium]|nr:hydratase [Clostridiales bacterium]